MLARDLRKVNVDRMRQVGTLVDLVKGMPNGDPRYALFLGAGASLSSGIPTSKHLIAQWRRRVYLDQRGWVSWKSHYQESFQAWLATDYPRWRADWLANFGRQPSEYSLLFSYACPDTEARQGFIEQLCSGCEPGPGYIYLASLVLSGKFQTFLTTNFDDLLHDALFRYAGLKPMVCAFDSQVSSIRLTSPRAKIIKLHGDFLFNNLRNVGQEVNRLDRNMEEKFERACETYGLIVLGYGGHDQSVMALLRTMLHRQDCLNHGLHWCLYSDTKEGEPREGQLEIPEDLYRMWESYGEKVHLYQVGSFDEVMEAVYRGCRCVPPPELAEPRQKALYVRLREGIDNADQTWRLTPGFSRLLGEFRERNCDPPSEVLLRLDLADQCHREGLRLQDEERFGEAQRKFEEAINLATQSLEDKDITPCQQVRALRRRCGSLENAADLHRIQAGRGLPPGADSEFATSAAQARDDARKGLDIDRELKSPPELRGHRLNLWYNGLIAYAFRKLSANDLSVLESLEALEWLESIVSDELHADEYLGLLRKESGGAELVEFLQSFSANQAPPLPAPEIAETSSTSLVA